MSSTFKGSVKLIAVLFFSFYLSGCLDKESDVSLNQRSIASDPVSAEPSDPYASCEGLREEQILELSDDNPNLITNGSFEEGHSLGLNKWKTFSEYGDWKAEERMEQLVSFEIQKGNVGGIAAHDGTSKVELDAHKNSGIEQIVSVESGKSYTLSVYYTPRALNRANSNSIDVIVDDQVILTLDASQKSWVKYEAVFTASSESAKIQFLATGTSDSFGGLIDSVSVVENGVDGAGVNLIQNGSFENGYIVTAHNGKWQVFESIEGWAAYVSSPVQPRIEIQNGPTIGGLGAQDGLAKVELDSHKVGSNTHLYQEITTEPGKKYILKYYYSPRVKNNSETNRAGVYWNGDAVESLNGTQRGWVEYISVLDAATNVSKISFHGEGTEDTVGAYLDNVSIKEVNCNVESSISFLPDAKDLNTNVASFESYSPTADSAVMLYRVDKINSPKKIKSIKWTYGDRSFTGSAFRTYVSEEIGTTVNVELEDVDGFKVQQNLSLEFEDECSDSIENREYGFCLKSNDYERDGNYVNPNNGSLSFYLSHGDPLEGNIEEPTVYLISDDEEEEHNVTAASIIQGQNLIINTQALASINIDLNKKYYVSLDGSYTTVSIPLEETNARARSKSFKIGLSNLNITASEAITEFAIVSVDGEFGVSSQQNIGTSYSLSNLPAGTYSVHVKNNTKEGYASFRVNPGESVDLSFSMQPVDVYDPVRQPLANSFTLSSGVSSFSALSVGAFSTGTNSPADEKDYTTVYLGSYGEDNLTCSGLPSKSNPYTINRFTNNFNSLKKKILKAGVDTIPDPIVFVDVNRVNGYVSGYPTVGPDKLEDKGLTGEGVPVEPGGSYVSLMFGEHPLLFKARSQFNAQYDYRCCLKSAENSDQRALCRYERDRINTVWKDFEDAFAHGVIEVQYTVTGTVNGELVQEEKHLMTFSSEDFVTENGGFESASLEWIFSDDIGDGWLLQQPKTIEIPGYFEDPKVSVELLTKIPVNVVDGYTNLQEENFWIYFSAGLIKDERLPSIAALMPVLNNSDLLGLFS